jgi:hypothetical protein
VYLVTLVGISTSNIYLDPNCMFFATAIPNTLKNPALFNESPPFLSISYLMP